MAEPVEIFRYIRYLRLRWRWIAVSCAVAVAIAAIVTMLMTRQYTATARILVEPPAGADLKPPFGLRHFRALQTLQFGNGQCRQNGGPLMTRARQPVQERALFRQ